VSTAKEHTIQRKVRQPSVGKRQSSASERTNFRIIPEIKRLIVRAAALKQTTLSQFMIEASVEAAQAVLADRTRFSLSEGEWKNFNRLLDAPPKRIEELAVLLKEQSVFEKP
jgi:uncharacterized protein (DUF1778 family)